MDEHAWQRAEPQAAAGFVGAAVVLFVAVTATGGSPERAALVAVVALVLGAALGLDAWRRSAARAAHLQASLRSAQADAARAGSARAAAEADLERVRDDAAREVERHAAAAAAANDEIESLRGRAAQQAERERAERERLEQALRRAEQAGARQR
jgi:hypothetical protein